MRWADLTTSLIAAAWGYLLIAGIDGLVGIQGQHVLGYPAWGQVIVYAGIPSLALCLLAGAVVLSRKARWFYDAYPFAVGFFGFAILPVLMAWGGGV